MKYYIIAGEASGDLHGANLIKQLKKLDTQADFRCWGGDLMQAETGSVVKHIKDLAFMGFIEVAMNLRTILGNMKFCKADIMQYQPDCVIFIDYPGFNLPIAKFTHQKGLKNSYYISPQVWAWKKGRVKTMRKVLDALYVILPFEEGFFADNKMKAEFVGHPLLDAIQEFRVNMSTEKEFPFAEEGKKIIALLPGSRKQEISKMLPVMLSLPAKFPEYTFVIAGVKNHGETYYKEMIGNRSNVHLVFDSTYDLLLQSYAAMVTSGTATLETALFSVPEVVCYKGSFISYWIARNLIKGISYISLVNLIMNKEIVKELIQNDMNEQMLEQELRKITQDTACRETMLQSYTLLKGELGNEGASENTARKIIKSLSGNNVNQQ